MAEDEFSLVVSLCLSVSPRTDALSFTQPAVVKARSRKMFLISLNMQFLDMKLNHPDGVLMSVRSLSIYSSSKRTPLTRIVTNVSEALLCV